MGLDISKFTNLISDVCSEVKCKFACCHDGVVMEFDNKDMALIFQCFTAWVSHETYYGRGDWYSRTPS